MASDRLHGLLLHSLGLTLGTLAVALPLGVFLAVMLTKTTLPGRRVLGWLLVAWLFVPLFVQAAAWQAAVGQGGWLLPLARGSSAPLLTGWFAAIVVHGTAAIPWVALFVGAALSAIPREAEEDALLDATPGRVLLRVSLPRVGGHSDQRVVDRCRVPGRNHRDRPVSDSNVCRGSVHLGQHRFAERPDRAAGR